MSTWDVITAAQHGDRTAFARFWVDAHPVVHRYVRSRVNDPWLAQDITSEAFTKALGAISTVRDTGRDPAAWVVTIARNLILDHAKSATAQRETFTATGDIRDIDRTIDGPEDTTVRSDTARCVRDSIAAVLNPGERECVTLRFLHGLTIKETATEMGRTPGGTKTLQIRALQKLHTHLNPAAGLRTQRECANPDCRATYTRNGLYCSARCEQHAAEQVINVTHGDRCVIPHCRRTLTETQRRRRAVTCSSRCANHLHRLRALTRGTAA